MTRAMGVRLGGRSRGLRTEAPWGCLLPATAKRMKLGLCVKELGLNVKWQLRPSWGFQRHLMTLGGL